MSLLAKIFGADKAVEGAINSAKVLVDEAFYTREEEASDKAKATTEARGVLVKWLEATSPSRLARRVLALSITGVWLSLFVMATFLDLAAIWFAEKATQLTASAVLVDGRTETMTSPVMLILGFYFAAPYMGDVAKTALERMGK